MAQKYREKLNCFDSGVENNIYCNDLQAFKMITIVSNDEVPTEVREISAESRFF